MRVIIQRVDKASVTVNHRIVAHIKQGLLIFVGIEDADNEEDIEWLCGKICHLRIFNDDHGIMNLSVQDIQGEILVVSQFTLYASTKKGNRPSYIKASKPEIAIPLYQKFLCYLSTEHGKEVKAGIFGEMMKIELVNDGPVTIVIDTKNKE
mgnify:CR=1 FL=1